TETAPFIAGIGATISPLGLIPTDTKALEREERKFGKDSEQGEKKEGNIIFGAAVLAVGVVAAVGLSVFAYMGYNTALETKEKLERDIKQLAPLEAVYNDYLSYTKGAEDALKLTRWLESPNDYLDAFFEEMEAKMPPEVLTLSADCTELTVTLNMEVPTKVDAARVLVQFRSFKSLKNVIMDGLTLSENTEDGTFKWTFTLVCEYNYAGREKLAPQPSPVKTPPPTPSASASPGATVSAAASASPEGGASE
ncbi:MAG: hypothetical protein LBC65_05835, partial [Oscillospiraceae bacterium]|nr:hypothetical protein [Oscillospiraceae bacterium]